MARYAQVGVAAAAVWIAAAVLPAAAQSSLKFDGDRAKIMALENAWNQAEERGDTKGLEQLFDDSLIYIDQDGSLKTKAEFLASVKASVKSTPAQLQTESVLVNTYGSVAIVSGVYILKGVRAGKPYVKRGRFLDTWLYKDNVWRCVAVEATPSH